ncbi:MAG: hypothetical protein KIT10_15600 [Flavobacteriales bacterium]|nr:hypothetical protein [Flavobacteriales bacterium]
MKLKTAMTCMMIVALGACGTVSDNEVTTTTPNAPSGQQLSPEDAQLVAWIKTASDEDVNMWINQLRNSPLPADFVQPDWLQAAPDLRQAREAIDARYGQFRHRLADPGERIIAAREDPLLLVYIVNLSKSLNHVQN